VNLKVGKLRVVFWLMLLFSIGLLIFVGFNPLWLAAAILSAIGLFFLYATVSVRMEPGKKKK